jgi:geranylgeranyl pyrophosphate synthase
MDDVLNLRGFEGNLKDRGEDVSEGKVTAPVAKAMSRLDLAGRRELWSILDANTKDRAKIDRAIALMESCGAVDAVEQEARTLIETTWARVEPVFEDTLSKLMIRAFGWYILERHY